MSTRKAWLIGLCVGGLFAAYLIHFNWSGIARGFEEKPFWSTLFVLLLGMGTPTALVSFIVAGFAATFADVLNNRPGARERHGRDDMNDRDG